MIDLVAAVPGFVGEFNVDVEVGVERGIGDAVESVAVFDEAGELLDVLGNSANVSHGPWSRGADP